MGSKTSSAVRRAGVVLIAFLSWSTGYADRAVEKNVVYGMYSGLALLMDVYRPDTPNGLGLVVIPGSGWEAPLDFGAEQLKESYELQAVFGIEDAQRAVRFIRHHADTYGIDPERIGAIGGSSGGHLARIQSTGGAQRSRRWSPCIQPSTSCRSKHRIPGLVARLPRYSGR